MTTTYEANVILKHGDYKTIGTRPVRHDGADKVTGRAKYGADFQATDLLHAKFVRRCLDNELPLDTGIDMSCY